MTRRHRGPLVDELGKPAWPTKWATPRQAGILADLGARYQQHEAEATLPRSGRGMFYDLRPRGMGNGITYRKPVEDPNSPDYHPLKAFGPLEAAPIHVQEVLALARRALIIPEKWVADARAPHPIGGAYWADIDDYAETVVESFELDPQGAQPVYVEILCEAEDLAPRLARIAGEFGVTVYSGGGFDGLKAKRLCGERAVRRSVPTVILHVGDYDKHGLAIYDAAAEDALAWFDFFSASRNDNRLSFRRLALTEEQAREHELLDADGKAEVDGLPVPVMDALLRGALGELLPPVGRETVAAERARQLPRLPAAIKRRL